MSISDQRPRIKPSKTKSEFPGMVEGQIASLGKSLREIQDTIRIVKDRIAAGDQKQLPMLKWAHTKEESLQRMITYAIVQSQRKEERDAYNIKLAQIEEELKTAMEVIAKYERQRKRR